MSQQKFSVGFNLNPKFSGLKKTLVTSGSTRSKNKIGLGTPSKYFRGRTSLAMFPDPMILPVFQEAALLNGILFGILRILKQKSLTEEGLVHSTVLGIGLWTFLGFKGWLLCVIYLIFGSVVTKIKIKEKESLGIAEARSGARGPENVWGSAATAMSCALMTYVLPPSMTPLLLLGYVASIATKLSDTVASEIGKAYGKTTYLITTLQQVPRGTEGAISLEGTVAGIAASVMVALLGVVLGLIDIPGIPICIFAAFVATTIESYIGAVYQDSISWLTNELVNLINTMIGAAVAVGLGFLLL